MKIEKIFIGGWFQRTTLHLTEIADFLAKGESELNFDKERLKGFREGLQIKSVTRKNWLLEYVLIEADNGINVRLYEDGLIILETLQKGLLKSDFSELENYYDQRLSPAISYIFSKGAPVPKELAQIKTLLPFVVWVKNDSGKEIEKFLDRVFEYKFETLQDTLTYIKELWKMTANYLTSAVDMFKEIQAESTKTSITSLQLITTLGVVAGIIGYLGRDKLPNLTAEGAIFFVILGILTWGLNALVSHHFSSKTYEFKKDERAKVFGLKEAREEI